jgi:hypothetical protein
MTEGETLGTRLRDLQVYEVFINVKYCLVEIINCAKSDVIMRQITRAFKKYVVKTRNEKSRLEIASGVNGP